MAFPALCGCFALAFASSCTAGIEAQREPGADASSRCEVREVLREPLVLSNGHRLLIGAHLVEPNERGDVLIAGAPSYHLAEEGAVESELLISDRIFGAVVPAEGGARIVPLPLAISSDRVEGVRASARGDGGWDVVFAELAPEEDGERRFGPRAAEKLWHGVLRDTLWSELDTLPLPSDEGSIEAPLASSLARSADHLAWALRLRHDDHRMDVLLLERRQEEWSYQRIPMRHTQVELGFSDVFGLIMAVVQPNPALQNDGGSLLFWIRDPLWRVLRPVVPGSRERVSNPVLQLETSTEAVLTWEASVAGTRGARAHAFVGALNGEAATVVEVDSSVVPMHPIASVGEPRGPHIWITDHVSETRDRRLRIAYMDRDFRGDVDELLNIPQPFAAAYAAAGRSQWEILIAGPSFEHQHTTRVPSSLLLRVRLECASVRDGADQLRNPRIHRHHHL